MVPTSIPKDFLDLVNGPRVAALTTLMPDGQPQTTVVWCDFDGTYVSREHNARLPQREEHACKPKGDTAVL